jgi:hypothetical protein
LVGDGCPGTFISILPHPDHFRTGHVQSLRQIAAALEGNLKKAIVSLIEKLARK